jgi:voltage-gated potassium channel
MEEKSRIKTELYEIIFEADTKGGKIFDIILLWLIISSITVVVLESIYELREDYGQIFFFLEWMFTILFTIEYGLRIYQGNTLLVFMELLI